MTRKENLKSKGVQMNIFECEGRFYLGNFDEAIDNFIHNNPNLSDFSVWLQDNYKQITIKL